MKRRAAASKMPTPDLLYDVARHQLDLQLEWIDALDSKVGVLYAVGSAEVGIAAAFIALKSGSLRDEAGFLVLGIVAYLVLTVASVFALWSRDWRIGSNRNSWRVCTIRD